MDELQEEIDSYNIDQLMHWLSMLQHSKEKLEAEMYMMPYNQELSRFVSDRMATNQMYINKITERLRKLRYEENK
tara:strand:- start:883 stop:1107 length:225 start_codon:yes stop_codon:yes gene_type:complete